MRRKHEHKTIIKALIVLTLACFLSITSVFPAYAHTVLSQSKLTKSIIVYKLESSITYSNMGNRTWNLTIEDMSISLFMNNSWQTVFLIYTSHPIQRVYTDEDGNKMALLNLGKSILKPRENLTLTVAYKIIVREKNIPEVNEEESGELKDIPKNMVGEFCEKEGCWDTENVELRNLAENLTNGETKVLTIVKRFIEWISLNIQYESAEYPRYPNETYVERRGDCDDQANLLITLCRIVGIPAYLQVGCIYVKGMEETADMWENHLKITLINVGWHGWAIVYIPPWGWLPVDLTYSKYAVGMSKDPLDAIRTSAVSLQQTVQYVNITKTDVAGESRRYREYIIENDFYIYSMDKMEVFKEQQEVKPPGTAIMKMLRIVALIILVSMVISIASAVIYFIYTKKYEVAVIRPY